jgi:hypothetical protein
VTYWRTFALEHRQRLTGSRRSLIDSAHRARPAWRRASGPMSWSANTAIIFPSIGSPASMRERGSSWIAQRWPIGSASIVGWFAGRSYLR